MLYSSGYAVAIVWDSTKPGGTTFSLPSKSAYSHRSWITYSLLSSHWNAVTWSFSFPWLRWPESCWSSYLALLCLSVSLLGTTNWSQLSAEPARSQNLLQGLYCSFAYRRPLSCLSSLTQRYPSSRFILNRFPQLMYLEMAGMSFPSF